MLASYLTKVAIPVFVIISSFIIKTISDAGEFKTSLTNHDEVLSAMLGNSVKDLYPKKKNKTNDQIALKFEDVSLI